MKRGVAWCLLLDFLCSQTFCIYYECEVCVCMCMYNEEEAGSYCCKIDVTGVDVRELLRSLLFVCHR